MEAGSKMNEITVDSETFYKPEWVMYVSLAWFRYLGETFHTDYQVSEQKARDVALYALVKMTSNIGA
jgi:hypothetical protein